jgi:CheY-specific phosphatase CheX
VTSSPNSSRSGSGSDPDLKSAWTGGSSSNRSTLDILVQICTVELFQSLGIAAAPLQVTRRAVEPEHPNDLVGVVGFSGSQAAGRITLSLNDSVYDLFPTPVNGSHAMRDAVRELTNQLIGRIKNRLMQFQVMLRIGLPSAMSAQAMVQQRQATALVVTYHFRTLRGEVQVTFEGTLGDAVLNYSNAVRVPKEGEFIPL